MDIEHKLNLIQQIHREQEKNGFQTQEIQKKWFHGFKFRFLIAVLLFLCFFVLDKKEIVYEEIGSAEIVEYISENMDIQELTAMVMSK